LFTVAVTCTLPASCAGASTLHVVSVFGSAGFQELQLTDVAAVVPNATVVAPLTKPVPVTVTLVPPDVGPSLGNTLDTVGKNLKRSADEIALVPSGVVTRTFTVPAASAGEIALIEVDDVTLKLAALTEPKLTAVAPIKFAPLTVTLVAPPTGPLPGVTFVTLGSPATTASPPPTAAQKDAERHEIEVRPLARPASTATGSLHELPLNVTTFPLPSVAAQNEADGHDIERMKPSRESIATQGLRPRG
jgi:hypothetical protein